MTKKRLGILSLLTLAAIFTATLWPLNPIPSNDITWKTVGNGIQFGAHGIVVSARAFQGKNRPSGSASSMELWLRPENVSRVSTILSFSTIENPRQFRLRQYFDGLLIQRDFAAPENHVVTAEIDANSIFHPGQDIFLTITSGKTETRIYQNGKLLQTCPGYRISAEDLEGDLVFGTSPFFQDSYEGDLHGLAFYAKELNEDEVRQHFQIWSQAGKLEYTEAERPIARYFFDEHQGTEIRNQVISQSELIIPKHFVILHKEMLRPPWKEFSANREYLNDVLRNIAGFLPLGVVLSMYFSTARSQWRAIFLAVLVGGLTSLGIEIAQAYIPARGSGITDVITNTLGTWIGAVLPYSRIMKTVLRKLGIGGVRTE